MYSEIYPHLAKAYKPFDNFELILKVLDKHFIDVFNLEALEGQVGTPGSYWSLFDACMQQLKGQYTENEVIKKLSEVLQQDEEIAERLKYSLIFVPPVENKVSNQLGLLEKLAVGNLKVAEPLTMIDMVRELNGFRELNKRHNPFTSAPNISAIHLCNVHALEPLDVNTLLNENVALLVNFNKDLKTAPKWGVLDLRNKAKPEIYCEMPLTENEKKEVDAKFGLKVNAYHGGGANSLASTGYAAMAWLDNNITKVWNFDVQADFNAILKDLMFVHFAGDNMFGVSYEVLPKELNAYCTAEFRHIYSEGKSQTKNNAFQGGFILSTLLTTISVLGEMVGEEFKLNDLKVVMDIAAKFKLDKQDLDPIRFKAMRTLVPGFGGTLAEYNNPKLLKENERSVSLTIPNSINYDLVYRAHEQSCDKTNTNPLLLEMVSEDKYRPGYTKEENLVVLMIFALIRSKAKKRQISIELPAHFQLNEEDQKVIVAALSDNAYVTEFTVNDNKSLQAIREQLVPTVARNRWLEENGYRPPMVDDYWKQAAKYWLVHLHEEPDVLFPKKGNEFFKRCVQEMGLQGLEAVLAILKDERERTLYIDPIFGSDKPAFYAAFQPHETRNYLHALIDHLRDGFYFPFSELGISYQPGNDREFIALLEQINHLERFEQITLTDCLTKPREFRAFLQDLTRYALDQQWVSLIVIPELEGNDNVSDEHRQLRVMYAQLNNVIMHNRHEKVAAPLIHDIKQQDDITDLMGGVVAGGPAPMPGGAVPPPGTNTTLGQDIQNAIRDLGTDTKWPLNRGGAVQLQLQQQQQIAQQRQIQQQKQTLQVHVVEAAISETLIDYTNIADQLGGYLAEFRQENKVDERCATLTMPDRQNSTSDAKLLRDFFHTWVNANPNVVASQAIHQMTIDAAKALLRKHRFLSSGLNPENLPKGFYTQRSKDGHMILCYSPELGYVSEPNAFTINLNVPIPEAEAWEGDFRQFNLEHYLNTQPVLNDDVWAEIKLFSQLQPPKNYRKDYVAFLQENPGLSGSLSVSTIKSKVIDYWPVFLQLWQHFGQDGIDAFKKIAYQDLLLTEAEVRDQLFKKLSPDLRQWSQSFNLDEDKLYAMGQVYYRNGDQGVALLLAKFRLIDETLGRDFFDHFTAHVLDKCSNFNYFMSVSSFTTMSEMIRKLRPDAAQANKAVWQDVLALHMGSVGWDNVEKLWHGFDYFVSELSQLGLALDGTEFNNVRPGNMLVYMDRVLESLKHISNLDEQKRFLACFSTMDMTHGGVPYALRYENFKHIDPVLQLDNFKFGSPTYGPNIADLYAWRPGEEGVTKMKRALASQTRFSREAYDILSLSLGNDSDASRNQLMWLLHLQYPATEIKSTLTKVQRITPFYQKLIATFLHHAVYAQGNHQLAVSLDAIVAFEEYCQHKGFNPADLMSRYPSGKFLEALSILWQSKRWSLTPNLIALFEAPQPPEAARCSVYLQQEGYKLAALFDAIDPLKLRAFYKETADILPVVQNELRMLITQLLSVDYDPASCKLDALNDPENWQGLLACIAAMKANPAQTGKHRIAFIEQLNARGIVFKYSKSGGFRALQAADKPNALGAFVDHEDRLWAFMLGHLAVPLQDENGAPLDPTAALDPIIRFLKILQLNRTYLNEIEPLLASFEQTKPGLYWSANYFYGLLRALQPEGEASFPISLLKVVLQEGLIAAKPMDSVEKEFPPLVATALQNVLKNAVFTRSQQSILCQLALREFNWQGGSALLNQIMTTLSTEAYADSRGYALNILEKCKSLPALQQQFDNCCSLAQCKSSNDLVIRHWSKTSALWLKTMGTRESETPLFTTIQSTFAHDPEKQALILHIVAWSSLAQGLKDTDSYEYELSKKAPKLVSRLSGLSMDDLTRLALCYPQQPSPGADDIVRLLKKRDAEKVSLDACLNDFLQKPYPESRTDYGKVALTRDADLRRMIADTRIGRGTEITPVSAKDSGRLTLIFSYLKSLERGEFTLKGANKAIGEMSRDELVAAYHELSNASKESPDNDMVRAQLWAVLFEVLGRTTRKYPHLAQQFALIANDVCIDATTRVVRLPTGEGKSHFSAMRAARQAGLGKTVDVCTAKRTLAERDLDDYQNLFSYLGLTTAYIYSKSSRDDYVNSQIHYTTVGDLSLFLDEQSYAGTPIERDRNNCTAVFDEFDFTRFEEGRKTQYNYARPTGKTPKQMTWFYQEVNTFYEQSVQNGLINTKIGRPITLDVLDGFAQALIDAAGDNEEKQGILASMFRDPVRLVQWLQSSYEAHSLKREIHYTVREENIEVGEESYPMLEIIPLSSDNQKMVGSTFSAGVQQLLAVLENSRAKAAGKSQNFHIHPESNIVSSQVAAQRMRELWSTWEGCSGTISDAQAATLHEEERTEVLHVPTNQRDLRAWHHPTFHRNAESRIHTLVKQIRICLDKKQSILFSCKNDKQVKDIQAELSKALTAEELSHFIFYTNEETRGASEVLADKRQQEQWRGGKKQQAVGLVASGFGRGDNVGVEAVFLFDVNDTNDLLQKGGRTARNGEEGEVFQFYLTDELQEEEAAMMAILEDTRGINIQAINETLGKVGGDENNALFERVMLLREYVFSLQNAASQGYHNIIAQLSTWGLGLLSQLTEPTVRLELTEHFSYQLKQLEKTWVGISSDEKLTADDKITEVERAVLREAERFAEKYNEKGAVATIEPFELAPHKQIDVQLVVPTPHKSGARERSIAAICSVVAGLPDVVGNKRASIIPRLLAVLSGEQALPEPGSVAGSSSNISRQSNDFERIDTTQELQAFAQKIANCKSTNEFVNALEIAAEQVSKPSEAWEKVKGGVIKGVKEKDLLKGVQDELRTQCADSFGKLLPVLQEKMAKALCASGLLSTKKRVELALPIINHLGRFSPDEQRQWGVDYIEEMDNVLRDTPASLLSTRLENSSPMPLRHFNGLWRVAQNYSSTSGELTELLPLLERATKGAPEQRFRLLTKWEAWTRGIEPKVARPFLISFCQVMASFEEGRDWDTFVSFVNKTQAWWNKGDGKYQPELRNLWDELARYAPHIPALSGFIQWSLDHADGKSWFQLLPIGLRSKPEHLVRHQENLKTLWGEIDQEKLTKREKTASFTTCVEGLADFYKVIATFDAALQAALVTGLSGLDAKKQKRMLELVRTKFAVFSQYPQVFMLVMGYMAAPSNIPLARVESLSQILLKVAAHEKAYPGSLKHLMRELRRVDKALLQLDDEKFKSMMTLMDRYIEKSLQYPQVLSVMLDYMCDPAGIPLVQVEAVSQLLLKAAGYPDKYQESIKLFVGAFGDFKAKIQQLDNVKFNSLMKIMGDAVEKLLQYPQLITVILDYMCTPEEQHKRVVMLSEVLLKATDLQEAHPGSIDSLIAELEVHRIQLRQLGNNRYSVLVELMQDNLEALLTHRPLMHVVLDRICDGREKLDRVVLLSQVLLAAVKASPENIGELIARFEAFREPMRGLADDKFISLMTSTTDNIGIVFSHPHVHDAMVTFMCSSLPLNRVLALIDLLRYTVDNHSLNIKPLIAALDRFIAPLHHFSDVKFDAFMVIIKHENETLFKHPEVLEAIFNYMRDDDIPVESAQVLMELLLQVVSYQEHHPRISIEHLISGVSRFKGRGEERLKLLADLLHAHPEQTVELLFNQVPEYLATLPPSWRPPVQEVVQKFQQVAKEHDGDPEAIMNAPAIDALFEFDHQSDETRKQRIILMHLLHTQDDDGLPILVTAGVSQDDHHDYIWDGDDNDKLLKLGFEQYLKHTKVILETKSKIDIHQTRDLSVAAQRGLLQLTDELAIIGKPRLPALGAFDTEAKVSALGKGLGQLQNNYSSRWFRSAERKKQFSDLQETVNQLLHSDSQSGLESRYEMVWRALRDAKFTAMDSDMRVDSRRWFNMNRKGNSYYFNTLNQMQDLVLRHWVQDMPAVHRFQVYDDLNRNEFLQLTERLKMRVVEYNDPKNRNIGRQLSQFFGQKGDKEKLQTLAKVLAVFTSQHTLADGQLTGAEVRLLMDELHRDAPRLPGHLATLANEVMTRGESLAMHLLEQEEAHRTGRNTLGGTPAGD